MPRNSYQKYKKRKQQIGSVQNEGAWSFELGDWNSGFTPARGIQRRVLRVLGSWIEIVEQFVGRREGKF